MRKCTGCPTLNSDERAKIAKKLFSASDSLLQAPLSWPLYPNLRKTERKRRDFAKKLRAVQPCGQVVTIARFSQVTCAKTRALHGSQLRVSMPASRSLLCDGNQISSCETANASDRKPASTPLALNVAMSRASSAATSSVSILLRSRYP